MTQTKEPKTGGAGDVAATGNFLVADGARLEGNFRCDGHARIGRGAVVAGGLDVAGSLAVREAAAIAGTVTAATEVDWHPTASAAGMFTEGPFRIGAHPLAASVEAIEGVAPWDPKEGSE